MVGISPRLAAGFDPNAAPSEHPVAILSDALWCGYLQADSGILGKTINVNGKPAAVAGVMPPGFVYPDGADVAVWLPDAVPPAATVPSRKFQLVRVIGRLKAGITLEQARADLERIARGMDAQYPTPWAGYHAAATVQIVSLQNVVGIYGVISYSVARRTCEIGLRIALGAQRSDVLRMVVWSGLRMTAFGIAIGLAGAMLVMRVLKTFLYEIDATDPITFGVACAILGSAAVLASYLPARRAAVVDPMAAMRQE
jgi:hypothetical protein